MHTFYSFWIRLCQPRGQFDCCACSKCCLCHTSQILPSPFPFCRKTPNHLSGQCVTPILIAALFNQRMARSRNFGSALKLNVGQLMSYREYGHTKFEERRCIAKKLSDREDRGGALMGKGEKNRGKSMKEDEGNRAVYGDARFITQE
ncbi:hypothetical protein PROFUN_04150 [Planoprotostelium fungivorum]|uniref:Uncharacterized protein n=1 Tax=Planoprotostelium fungivorum TaxID=1890364 RepID=A0A2P6NJP9_9EUKA|nr:hypothetical protein PROFUN_04150 [Planoprotostelium fungivorum]